MTPCRMRVIGPKGRLFLASGLKVPWIRRKNPFAPCLVSTALALRHMMRMERPFSLIPYLVPRGFGTPCTWSLSLTCPLGRFRRRGRLTELMHILRRKKTLLPSDNAFAIKWRQSSRRRRLRNRRKSNLRLILALRVKSPWAQRRLIPCTRNPRTYLKRSRNSRNLWDSTCVRIRTSRP